MQIPEAAAFQWRERVTLPIIGIEAELHSLERHSTNRNAPPGIRYLQVRKRLKTLLPPGARNVHREAYEKQLPGLRRRFAQGLVQLEWDLAVQAPSCSTHAEEFGSVVREVEAGKPFVVLTYERSSSARKEAALDATVEDLQMAMGPEADLPALVGVRRLLIIDDVFASGKTAAAIVQKLRTHGLSTEAHVTIAVALRAIPDGSHDGIFAL